MKLKKYLIIIGLAGITLSACNDLDLQPLSEASSETWFTDRTQVEMSLNTLYLHQFWPMFKNDFTTFSNGARTISNVMSLDEPTDDWMNRTSVVPFINGTLSGSNSTFLKNTWSYSYKAISRCNTILANIERSKENLAEELYERYMADARFVRACQYARLISYFGDVVYFTEDMDLEEGFAQGRVNKMEVLSHIYEDFDYAIAKLPVAYESSEVKRATKGAALGMKARIALFVNDHATARDAAKACMDLEIYQLYPDFGELFLSKTKNSVETIFGIPRSTEYKTSLAGGAVTAYLSRNVTSPSTTASPSWDLLCAFLCTDGKPIDESPLYDRTNPFKNRDPRCGYTIVEFNSNYFGFNYTPHPDSALCWNYTQKKFVTNKDSKAGDTYASYNGLILRKGIDEDWSDNLEADNDKLILRYADILMMYAEAKIELNNIDQSVLDAMNKVRARAYKVDFTSNLYPKITETDQAKLRTILRTERRMEFAFEALRYNDLLRWRIGEIVLNYKNYGLPSSLAATKTYVKNNHWFFPGIPQIDENGCPDFTTMANVSQCRVLSQRVFDASKHYLWPIPADDIAVCPNLKQNTGY
ncbi:RagB/SusD family nutrient uptake outer membrane protein [Gaoshiqia sp. Z1-71]|uniref:RagB/SusD family nutrient uptake outer membrane protein n=1 Tax=Gaoshiqia hydrogeniformans TaxID=3290090 RepID=UPI003BF82253